MLNKNNIIDLGGRNPKIEVDDCLYYFDEPLIFLSMVGFSQHIFVKIDETEENDIYLASMIDKKTVDLLKSGKISVLGSLSEYVYTIYSEIDEMEVVSAYSHHIADIDDRYLPKSGRGLSHKFGECSDYYPKSESLTVRLYGGLLNSRSISLKQFKSLVEKFQNLVRAAYVPLEFDDPKRKAFSFDMAKPEFGSLVLSVSEPEIMISNIVEYTGDDQIDETQARARVDSEFENFFKTIENAFDASSSKQSRLNKGDEAESDLMAIKSILPSNNSEYTGVEFFGFSNGKYRHFSFEKDQSKKLSEMIDETFVDSMNVSGVIQIINAKSGSFVIQPNDGKRVTCEMISDVREKFFADREFKIGARVSVFGELQKRKLRDKLFIETLPKLLS